MSNLDTFEPHDPFENEPTTGGPLDGCAPAGESLTFNMFPGVRSPDDIDVKVGRIRDFAQQLLLTPGSNFYLPEEAISMAAEFEAQMEGFERKLREEKT